MRQLWCCSPQRPCYVARAGRPRACSGPISPATGRTTPGKATIPAPCCKGATAPEVIAPVDSGVGVGVAVAESVAGGGASAVGGAGLGAGGGEGGAAT